jgi:hypothetical protein
VNGIIMDVKVSTSRLDAERDRLSPSDRRRQVKQIQEDYKTQMDKLREQLTEALSNILLGEKIPLDVINGQSGEIIIPANRKITKTLLRKLAAVAKHIEIDPSPVRIKIMEIIASFQSKFDELEGDRERKIATIETGDETAPASSSRSRSTSPRSRSLRSVTRWPAATATRASSPRSCPRKTCPSCPTAPRSKSASTPSACLRA